MCTDLKCILVIQRLLTSKTFGILFENARLGCKPALYSSAFPHRSSPMSKRLLSSSFWLSFLRSANTWVK